MYACCAAVSIRHTLGLNFSLAVKIGSMKSLGVENRAAWAWNRNFFTEPKGCPVIAEALRLPALIALTSENPPGSIMPYLGMREIRNSSPSSSQTT